ncbi:MAG: DUF4190 domain-containing protein [Pirellulales bacterium]|nr:DUF4190 domain-containing protein [Pirellulales bacterium]
MSTPQLETSKNRAASDGTIQYRAVSGLAILALALGIASAAAMVGPVLWLVPLLAIITALVAMRRISASEELTGWYIALLGLLLAILFGVAAPARTLSRQYWLACRAEAFSGKFLEFLQHDKPYAAHQLRERSGVRKPLNEALPEAYNNDPESQKSFAKFVAEEPMKSLLEAGQKSVIMRTSTESLGRDDQHDLCVVHYQITAPGRKPISVMIAVKRSLEYSTGRETWQIENVAVE